MNFKEGINGTAGLKPEILKVLPTVELMFQQAGFSLTITCTTGSHARIDPHTWGYAVDCRTRDMNMSTPQQDRLAAAIQHNIGDKYYVQSEHDVFDDEQGKLIKARHIHVQLKKALWRAIVISEGHDELPPE